jgi:hypothetical protein
MLALAGNRGTHLRWQNALVTGKAFRIPDALVLHLNEDILVVFACLALL